MRPVVRKRDSGAFRREIAWRIWPTWRIWYLLGYQILRITRILHVKVTIIALV